MLRLPFVLRAVLIGLFFVHFTNAEALPPKEGNQQYIIVLKSPPVFGYSIQEDSPSPLRPQAKQSHQVQLQTLARRYEPAIIQEQQRVITQMQALMPQAQVIRQNTRLINAITVDMQGENIAELASHPNVAYIAPVRQYKPLLTASHPLMNLPQAWDENFNGGETGGEGVLIAIVDTGIDHTLPVFDDTGYTMPEGFPKGRSSFTNNKIIVARSFPPLSGTQGDISPRDREGHGTNVASIAAANFNTPSPLGPLSGVAPKAFLGNYKIFTEIGFSNDDQVISAIEQAVEDGADVINMSFGFEQMVDPQHSPIVQVIRQAIRMGVVVVTAAGNNGAAYAMGAPPQIEEVITVGSVTNAHQRGFDASSDIQVSFLANEDPIAPSTSAVFTALVGPMENNIVGTFPIVDVDTLDGGGFGGPNDGLLCDRISLDEPLNAWLLVQRGDCLFARKSNFAREIGALGVLFYDSPANEGGTPSAERSTLPSMLISRNAGLQLKNALQENPNTFVKIETGEISSRSVDANLVSSFSGRGPGPHYTIKPDVVAVGEYSYGATQDDFSENQFNPSGFDWFTGTSMSSPRVAGLAALLKQKHPNWPAGWIKSAIVQSGRGPLTVRFGGSEFATVLKKGTGHVDAARMLTIDTLILPAMVGFGKQLISSTESVVRHIEIVNPTPQTYHYQLRLANSAPFNVALSETEFNLAPYSQIEIEVTAILPGTLVSREYESELILTNLTKNEEQIIPLWVEIKQVNSANGTILLIDDDDGETFEQFYQARLTEIGFDHTTWDYKAQSEFPTLNYMKQFDAIVWFMGETSLNAFPSQTSTTFTQEKNKRQLFEDDIMQYLMQSGKLFLTGQDYLDQREEVAFATDLIGVNLGLRDFNRNRLYGIDNNPISRNIDNVPFEVPNSFDLIPDRLLITDHNTTTPIFFADSTLVQSMGVMVDACAYRMVFCAFPVELLPPATARTILHNSLRWFAQKATSPTSLISITPNEIFLDEINGPVPVTIKGQGFGLDEGYRASLGAFPLLNVTRVSCDTLTAELQPAIQPADYSLQVVTGDGQHLRLKNAIQVHGDPLSTLKDWTNY